MQEAVGIGLGNHFIHQGEAGVSPDQGLFRLAAQHVRPVPPGRRQAGQLPVVPGVDAVGDTLLRLLQHRENIADLIQLGLARFAPGHVQPQRFGLPGGKRLLHGGKLQAGSGYIHGFISLHGNRFLSLRTSKAQLSPLFYEKATEKAIPKSCTNCWPPNYAA